MLLIKYDKYASNDEHKKVEGVNDEVEKKDLDLDNEKSLLWSQKH